ncbi:MAG: sulfotransferase [Anaerolineae bacterium]|nr:sulfotransferase [Anaerolineae bacterium]
MGIKRDLLLNTAAIAPNWWSSRLQNPVFIVGCARSGTTILSEWFHHHYDVANLSEANDIWDPSGYPWASSSYGKDSPPIWIDPEAYTARWWRDNERRQTKTRAIFGVYQTVKRAKVFVNKTPLNTFRIPQLLKTFPEARFVHLVRDGRAVTQSYAKKQRHDMNKDVEVYRALGYDYPFEELALKLAAYWQRTIDEVTLREQQFNLTAKGQMLEIKYDDLCSQTDATLEKLCQYMGIQKDRFKPEAQQIQMKDQDYKWRTELSPEIIAATQQLQANGLKRWGYV